MNAFVGESQRPRARRESNPPGRIHPAFSRVDPIFVACLPPGTAPFRLPGNVPCHTSSIAV